MTTETILTDDQIARMRRDEFGVWRAEDHDDIERFARAVEQALLQSPEVQALRKDAERWRKAASHVYEIKQTHEPTGENQIRRLQIDLRKTSTSSNGWLNDRIDIFGDADAAMEQQT